MATRSKEDQVRTVYDVAAMKRPRQQAVEDEVLATAHALGAALHRVGAWDAGAMRGLNALCLPPLPE